MTTQLNLDQKDFGFLTTPQGHGKRRGQATLHSLDICENNHRGADTSVLANPSHSVKAKQRERVYGAIKRAGYASCERIEISIGGSHQSVSARISELLRDNRISICGRSTTISGKPCRLYRIV